MIYVVYFLFVLLSKVQLQELFITRTSNVTGERVQDGSLFNMSQLNSEFSLFCWYHTVDNRIPTLYWSISNHYESNGKRISMVNIGWNIYDALQLPYKNEKLSRSQTTEAVEGNFKCNTKDSNLPTTSVQVGIYYPILSIDIDIHKIETSGTLEILCTSTGGRPERMSVSGPSGVVEDNMNIVNVGRAVGTGNDSFTSNTTVHDGRNGDTYTCFATNGITNISNNLTLGDDPSSIPNRPVTIITSPVGDYITSSPKISTQLSGSSLQSPLSVLIALATFMFGILIGVVATLTIMAVFKGCRNTQSKVETVVEDNPAYGVSLGAVNPVNKATENAEYEQVEF